MLSPSEMKIVLEAALLAAHDPLPISELRKMFDEEIGADTIRSLLEELREAWKDRGIELVATASGWRFQTRVSYQRFLERIHPEKAPRYSRAVLETLAIVAYRQPVTKSAVERIRGVDSDYTIRSLLHRRLVVELGRSDAPGRPFLYGTGFEFLERFGLTSLEELPPLDVEVAARLVDEEAATADPGEGAPDADGTSANRTEAAQLGD